MTGPHRRGIAGLTYMGVHGIGDNIASGESLRDTFVAANGCAPQDTPEPADGSLTHITTTYEGCADGYAVRWAAFDGGHIGAPQDGSAAESGSHTWVPGEAWEFITQFETTP